MFFNATVVTNVHIFKSRQTFAFIYGHSELKSYILSTVKILSTLRDKKMTSWLSDWWLTKAYLARRDSVASKFKMLLL